MRRETLRRVCMPTFRVGPDPGTNQRGDDNQTSSQYGETATGRGFYWTEVKVRKICRSFHGR